MGNVNDFRRGARVMSTGEAGPGHPRWHGDDFPGWGAPDAAAFLRDPRPGVAGIVHSVESHGSNPWTRYGITWDTGETTSGATPDRDFTWID